MDNPLAKWYNIPKGVLSLAKKKKIKEQSLAERQKKINDVYREEPLFPNKELKFSVDLPLSVNHMYVRTYRGGQRLSKAAEEYVHNTRAKVLAEMEDNNFVKTNNASWHYLDLVVYMPDKRYRDSHNMLKLLMDTLELILFENDYYILPNIRSVELDRENPRLDIIFRPQLEQERSQVLNKFNKVAYV